MIEFAERALRFGQGTTLESRPRDEMRYLAILRAIEVIGEASTKVSEQTRQTARTIDWRAIRGM